MAGGNPGGNNRGALSEINVTPLVDVMLVLLIVFMVTTPIIVDAGNTKVDVKLPVTDSKAPLTASDVQQLVLTLSKDQRITMDGDVGKAPIVLADCGPLPLESYAQCLEPIEGKIRANPKVQEEGRLFLKADRELPYGFVVDVMARLRNAGVQNLGMVTNQPGADAPPPSGAAP